MKSIITRWLIQTFCWLLSIATAVVIADERPDDEQLFKAAYIYNFSKFTRWPESTWSSPDTPLNLCMSGKDELVESLKRLSGRKIKGREVTLLNLDVNQSFAECHVLYIALSQKDQLTNILQSIQGKAILTISELPEFKTSEGMISLFRQQGRTRFAINLRVVRASGLTISSRLLRLAEIVEQ